MEYDNQSASTKKASYLNYKNSAKKKDFLCQLSNHKKIFCARDGFSLDAQYVLSILACDEQELSKMVHPYDIALREEKTVSMLLTRNLISKLKDRLGKMEDMQNSSQSFDVAKLLLYDMIAVLLNQYVLVNGDCKI
jgi:hypothetical protein